MRIGIDARAAAEVAAGRGRYVRELIDHLALIDTNHRYLLFARRRWDRDLDERFNWMLGPQGLLRWQTWVARKANRTCDVFLATNTYLLTALLRAPSVAVVHDLAAWNRAMGTPRGSGAERVTLRLAVRRAAGFIADSDATRRDLVERLPRAAGKTEVVHLAASFAPEADAKAAARKYGLSRPYVLATGTLEPRKNLPRLIEAFSGLPADLAHRYDLVLVGAAGWDTDATFAAIARHRERVKTLGYVLDEDLPGVYRGATVFCYPSLFEGFGLPVLEAMQVGTPVVTSAVSSLPEVGGEAVHYVDPLSVESIRAGLIELLRDSRRREELSRLGRERSAAFTWKSTAASTLQILEACGQARAREPT